MLTIKLYDNAGTYIKDLTTVGPITIKASKDQQIRRSLSFTVPVSHLVDVKKLGRRVKVVDDDGTQRFSGYIDDARPHVANDAWVQVTARDKAKIFKLARFAGDTTGEDLTTTEATRSITSSSASTEMAATDEIQGQGVTYGLKLEATVAGITSEITPDSQTGDPVDGDLSIDYSVDGLSLLTLTFFVDLLAQETLGSFTVTTNGTNTAKQYSTDGDSFSDFSGTPTGRYLKVVITKSSGPITAGITATANGSFPASNVETDNSTPWRPDPTDVTRQLTLSCASALVNAVNLKCGVSDLDRQTAYIVDIEAEVSDSWTEVASDKLLVTGFNEIAFSEVTATGVRVTFKKLNAPVAVRYAELVYVDSIATLDQFIEAILLTENELDYSLIQETRRLPAGNALTFLAGDEKLQAMIDIADSINWEFFYDEDDKPVFRPQRWADPSDPDILEITALLQWSPIYSDAEIYNVVLAKYEAGDTSLWASATNDSGASATGTVNIGTRTSPVLRNPMANTQAKLDAWAQEQLANFSRRNTTATAVISALKKTRTATTGKVAFIMFFQTAPSTTISYPEKIIDIEPGQIVKITEPDTNTTAELFRVNSVTLEERDNTIDLTMEVGIL